MRILIVEDEKNLAESLRKLLADQGYQTEKVGTGDDGLAYARTGQYDAIILDVMLPNMNGFQITAALRAEGIATPILLLTALDDVQSKVHGLDSGADDYLTKPFTAEELLARVRALLRRQGGAAANTVRYGDVELYLTGGLLLRGDKQVRLSQKELDVMRLLMAAPGALVSKEELIAKVWGLDSEAVDNNVEAYISFLRKKLFYLGSRVTITARRRMGYALEDEPC